jgi:type IV pilus assembly protein PilM
MIKNIFLPEQIKNYYLFSKRIIGFDIGRTHISASQIYCAGNTITIEKCLDEKIETGIAPYQDRAAKAIQAILGQLDQYDAIRSSLPSEFIIFKELRLPFLAQDKIAKVLPYEIEPLLPFKLTDATIDFIITKRHETDKSVEFLVAAVQNQHISNHLQLFATAGISPEVITVDLFALYGLYLKIPEYAALQDGTALIDIGKSGTRIAYIQDGQLRLIRSLGHGTLQIAKTASEQTHIPVNTIIENSIRFGISKPDDQIYTDVMSTALTSFWRNISFTLSSFTMQAEPTQALTKILLLGGGAEIKGIETFIADHAHIPTEKFHIERLFQDSNIRLKNKILIPTSTIVSLSTALPNPATEDFNLRKHQFATANESVMNKQLMVSGSLLFFLIALFGFHIIWQTRKLENTISSSKKEAIGLLKEKFSDIEGGAFDTVIENAKEKLADKEKIVSAFNGVPFLKYLLELTNKIDAQAWGFVIEKLVITDEKISMEAQVKDLASLKALEHALDSSKLFYLVEPKEDWQKFTMELRFKESEES